MARHQIRPDRVAPVLWRVTIRRYDGVASITVTEADPDAALDELFRYAAVDAEDAEDARTPIVALDEHASEAGAEGP